MVCHICTVHCNWLCWSAVSHSLHLQACALTVLPYVVQYEYIFEEYTVAGDGWSCLSTDYNGVTVVRNGRIQSSRSTSSERFILEVMVEKMSRFCLRSGMGNSIFRSSLPGRRRAGSRVSDRLVAMITCMYMYAWWLRLGGNTK